MRQRDLPAHVVVYYVIALALYMQSSYREVLRCLLDGIQWLHRPVGDDQGGRQVGHLAGAHAARMGADASTARRGREADRGRDDAWRLVRAMALVSLDGSTLDVADETANDDAFGRPGASRGRSAYPQIRFVALVENGTHVLFGSQMAGYGTGEITLAKAVLANLRPGMLCLADRQFFGFELWNLAHATKADLLWRIKKNMRLACDKRLPDGSYQSHIFPSEKDWRHKTNGVQVRVSTIAWTAWPMPNRSTGS